MLAAAGVLPIDASADGAVSALCSVPTLLNKVLVGTERGALLLVNAKARKVVHRFTCVIVKSVSVKCANSSTSTAIT